MARKAGVSTTRTSPKGETAKRRSDERSSNKTSGTRAPRLVPASEVPKSDTECKAVAKKVEREFDEYAEHGEKAFDLVLSMGWTLYAMRHYVRNAKAGKDAWNKWCDLNGNLRIRRHQANRYIRVFVAHKKHPCKFENRRGLSLRAAITILNEAKGGTKATSRRVFKSNAGQVTVTSKKVKNGRKNTTVYGVGLSWEADEAFGEQYEQLADERRRESAIRLASRWFEFAVLRGHGDTVQQMEGIVARLIDAGDDELHTMLGAVEQVADRNGHDRASTRRPRPDGRPSGNGRQRKDARPDRPVRKTAREKTRARV